MAGAVSLSPSFSLYKTSTFPFARCWHPSRGVWLEKASSSFRCNAKKKLSFVDQILDYIEGNEKHSTQQPVNKMPILISKRQAVLCSLTITLVLLPSTRPTWGADKKSSDLPDDEESGTNIFGAVKSLLDPNETTKSGKVLPKAYLKSARDVLKNLRESLKEDPKDNAKFRRTADAAKESIRNYLNDWRGQQSVSKEAANHSNPERVDVDETLNEITYELGAESYMKLEKVIRALASFYSKAGPSAPLPEEVKSEILVDLDTAEEHL